MTPRLRAGRGPAAALALFVALQAAAPALRAEPSPAEGLERARVCQAALDLACSERELSALRDRAGLAPSLRGEVLRLSAEVALATGREPEASAFLGALLDLDPAFRPPEETWPPAWRAVLDRVRGGRVALPARAPEAAGDRGPAPGAAAAAPGTAPAAAPRTPLVRQWWLWTLVGVAAAGLGTGIYFLARPSGHRDGGTTARLEVAWPSP